MVTQKVAEPGFKPSLALPEQKLLLLLLPCVCGRWVPCCMALLCADWRLLASEKVLPAIQGMLLW